MSSPALDKAIEAGEASAAGGAFDAIVVGGGAAGGLAASLLCEGGFKVLLLDAGYQAPFWRRPFRTTTASLIQAVADPRLLKVIPHRVVNVGRKALRTVGTIRQPVQTQCFSWEQAPAGFVDDLDHPYVTPEGRPFNWIRSHGLGGRMVLPGHGRQYYRLGDDDLFPADNQSPPWPLSHGELDPWYAAVEKRLQLSGRREGVASPPDSLIATELQLTEPERELSEAIRKRWPGATPMLGRYAPPLSSVAQAAETGRLVCRKRALANRVLAGKDGRASGVEWLDQATGQIATASAPVVFLCASTLESTRILLMSKAATGKAPGAESGALGRNLMDHLMVKVEGVGPRLPGDGGPIENGRCIYLPRFDRSREKTGSARGYGVQLYATPAGASSWFTAVAFAEVTPRADNVVMLDATKKDRWGNPALRIDFHYGDEDQEHAQTMAQALRELGEVARARLDKFDGRPDPPGTSIHECGTARMGGDRRSSVLDPFNQCWDLPGLYVTDGSSFPSQGAQNPTLTIMALTARACGRVLG